MQKYQVCLTWLSRLINQSVTALKSRGRGKTLKGRASKRVSPTFWGAKMKQMYPWRFVRKLTKIALNSSRLIIRKGSFAQKVDNFCILGSETSTYGFNVTGINARHTLIQGAADRPRAYISCHKNLKALPVENLCSRDDAIAIIDLHMARAGKLLVVSIYWDGRIATYREETRERAKLSR